MIYYLQFHRALPEDTSATTELTKSAWRKLDKSSSTSCGNSAFAMQSYCVKFTYSSLYAEVFANKITISNIAIIPAIYAYTSFKELHILTELY